MPAEAEPAGAGSMQDSNRQERGRASWIAIDRMVDDGVDDIRSPEILCCYGKAEGEKECGGVPRPMPGRRMARAGTAAIAGDAEVWVAGARMTKSLAGWRGWLAPDLFRRAVVGRREEAAAFEEAVSRG